MAEPQGARPSLNDVRLRWDLKLMKLDGVLGVAEGERDGKACIVVYVAKVSKSIMEQIPKQIEGFLVRVEESGEFRAL